jgi:hypothetical protein
MWESAPMGRLNISRLRADLEFDPHEIHSTSLCRKSPLLAQKDAREMGHPAAARFRQFRPSRIRSG